MTEDASKPPETGAEISTETGAEFGGAQPFEPGPADLAGCGKPAVVGCLVLLALLGAACVTLILNGWRLLEWGMGQYQQQVIQQVEDELEPSELERLDAAFRGARAAIGERRVDLAALQRLQRFMAGAGAEVDGSDVGELLEILDALAASPGAAPGPAAEPVPDASL